MTSALSTGDSGAEMEMRAMAHFWTWPMLWLPVCLSLLWYSSDPRSRCGTARYWGISGVNAPADCDSSADAGRMLGGCMPS